MVREDILVKLRRYCDYQDRCHQDVRRKLLSLQVYGDELEEAMAILIEEDLLNEERFAQAKRDHKNYWQWRDARNEARWRDQEQGVLDYDAKNMMHTFRLLFSAKKLLTEGEPKTRFSGADLDYLLSIRRGDFSYDLLIERAAKLTEELETLTDCAPLPESPDLPLINQLLCDVTQQWERDHA